MSSSDTQFRIQQLEESIRRQQRELESTNQTLRIEQDRLVQEQKEETVKAIGSRWFKATPTTNEDGGAIGADTRYLFTDYDGYIYAQPRHWRDSPTVALEVADSVKAGDRIYFAGTVTLAEDGRFTARLDMASECSPPVYFRDLPNASIFVAAE